MKYVRKILLLVFLCLTACTGKKDPDQPIHARITIQDYGTVDLELYPDIAPISVENFVKLAENGFDEKYGARPLRREIQRVVEDRLSEELLLQNIKLGDHAELQLVDGEITAVHMDPS